MWPGPYGIGASRKYLLASLDDSLSRMGLDYVDIFYAHRPWDNAPLEETMGALATAVHQGKALYVGISSYSPERTRAAAEILKSQGVPLLIHQPSYSMLNRWIETGLLDTLENVGAGCIAFSPLAQGLLTAKYLKGVPEDSRATAAKSSLLKPFLSENNIKRVRALNAIAKKRGQSLAQMAIAWVLARPARNIGTHRSTQRRPTRRLARRAQPSRIQPEGTRRHRPPRPGCGHRSLEGRARENGLVFPEVKEPLQDQEKNRSESNDHRSSKGN